MADDAVRRETDRLLELFQGLGAQRVDADILQPAEVLLDLYGEDIRARAYVTQDPLRGEQMLRPDFTVPVVQMHMDRGATPARYTYAGPVFRRQEQDTDRPNEYPQVGYEVFDARDRATVEASLFAAFHAALSVLPVTPVMGDLAILRAAVEGLSTTDHRKAALLRHLWRPKRFLVLLDRYSSAPVSPDDPETGPEIGLRSAAEVLERRARMAADADAPRLNPEERHALEQLLHVAGPLPEAIAALQRATMNIPAIRACVEALEARAAAFEAVGLGIDELTFEVTHGRTSMEYYDGFVFGFECADRPKIAAGGRYDALTRVLGQGSGVPALGGVIRPDLVVALREAAQ